MAAIKEAAKKHEFEEKNSKEDERSMSEEDKEDSGQGGIRRARTAFNYYTQETAAELKKEHPEIGKHGAMIKGMGDKWRAMSTEEKRKYVEMSEKDKERYKQEFETAQKCALAIANEDGPRYPRRHKDQYVPAPESTKKRKGKKRSPKEQLVPEAKKRMVAAEE